MSIKLEPHYILILHCPINTATTHIGSSYMHAVASKVVFGLVLVPGLAQSKAVPVSHLKRNHTPFWDSLCRHCDGEVVIHSTNGYPVASSPDYSPAFIE